MLKARSEALWPIHFEDFNCCIIGSWGSDGSMSGWAVDGECACVCIGTRRWSVEAAGPPCRLCRLLAVCSWTRRARGCNSHLPTGRRARCVVPCCPLLVLLLL